MQPENQIKNIGIAVIVIAIIAFSYWNFIFKKDIVEVKPVTSPNTLATVQSTVVSNIFSTLRELKSIHIDEEFLLGKAIGSLADFHRTVRAETKGRANPFAPLR